MMASMIPPIAKVVIKRNLDISWLITRAGISGSSSRAGLLRRCFLSPNLFSLGEEFEVFAYSRFLGFLSIGEYDDLQGFPVGFDEKSIEEEPLIQ